MRGSAGRRANNEWADWQQPAGGGAAQALGKFTG
eukprot:SAG22_NODE_20803_length_262_cov_1.073620_1_plen_33_part_10